MSLCDVDLVIKFGGSAITKKDSFETLNTDALRCAADLIRRCHENQLTCIVVHGAGSFGHHQAKEYQVNHGWTAASSDGENHVKKGFYLTRQSVTKLHHEVLDALIKTDVPAVGLSVCGLWKTENGTVDSYDLRPVFEVIKNGFIPVLHGDCVFDSVKGCTILSGDTIIQKISEDFNVGQIVFLTSVFGIYDKPPLEFPDAIVLRQLFVDRNGEISYGQRCEHFKKMFKKTPVNHLVKDVDNVRTTDCDNLNLTSPRTSRQDTEHVDSGENSKKHIDGKDIVTRIDGKDVTGGMMLKIKCAVDIVRRNTGKTKVFVCKVGTAFCNDICLHGKCERISDDSGTEISYSDL